MLLWAHGMLGSPQGRKVIFLRDAGLDVVAPDMRDRDLALRVDIAHAAALQMLDQHPRIVLGGSSLGGLVVAVVATRLAQTHPDRVLAMVLGAPAFHVCGLVDGAPAGLTAPPDLPVHIVHGRADDVVPVGASESYVARSGPAVTLEIVEDDHRLDQSLGRILAALKVWVP